MPTFKDLVKDQFQYGGKKYAGTQEKETTDILVEDYGWEWLVGTVNKYVYRYRNLTRERDLLKIGTYQFIKWLKLGYHLSEGGTAVLNCTTVETKDKFFDVFADRYEKLKPDVEHLDRDTILDQLKITLLDMRLNKSESNLFLVYALSEQLWRLDGYNSSAKHDTDTWVEEKTKK